MNKTLAFRIAFLKLLLNGTPLANIWDNAASSPKTSIVLSFHSSDPGTTGDQTTNEVTYGSYARVAVNRDGTGWTIDPTTGIATPTTTILLVAPTSGTGSITHVGLGRDLTGAGYLFYTGAILPVIVITVGRQPQITTSSQITES